MSFAYPPRKTSNPPPFKPRASKLPHLRRSRVKTIAVFALIIIGGLWVASKIFSGHGPSKRQPSGNPKVLIVTTLDAPAYGQAHTDSIKENRIQYAARHGRRDRRDTRKQWALLTGFWQVTRRCLSMSTPTI
jgi:mannan polymerase II complex MNN11 subunit